MILVTGATGLSGHFVVRELQQIVRKSCEFTSVYV